MSDFLELTGVKTHNLKNIHVKIPKNKITVISGVSGSGKSSLAFKTIYNIGQQKYLDSLSSYARMFIGGMSEEALYDDIKGLSPTISIEQKSVSANPRSTVGTITEIYDYYKLLFLNIGERKCVNCGTVIKKDNLSDIIRDLSTFKLNTKFFIKTQILQEEDITFLKIKNELLKLGFIRFSINDKIYTINDNVKILPEHKNKVYVLVDRLEVKDYSGENNYDLNRLKDSLTLTYKIGKGLLSIDIFSGEKIIQKNYSNIFICSNCGHIPKELEISSFSFNSPSGSCEECNGLGEKPVFLEENIVNPNLTLAEGAILPLFGYGYYTAGLLSFCEVNNININKKYRYLTKEERKSILFGDGGDKKYNASFGDKNFSVKYEGVFEILKKRYFNRNGGNEKNNIFNKALKLDQYIVSIECPTCKGHRLNKESLSVYYKGLNIGELSNKSIKETIKFFSDTKLMDNEEKITKNILKNVRERLEFLSGVGLDYITISRKSNTLSGGEGQRIRLATQIGTKLEGIIYILDEPSIGLHPRDNDMLIDNLKKLRDIGNTLIIVEHDEDIMKNADYIIDVGPGAGVNGGEIISEGTIKDIINDTKSVTGPYLARTKTVKIKRKKRKIKNFLQIIGASENNLKNINVKIPLENFTVVTGVSGSGKSSLVNHILSSYLLNKLNGAKKKVGKFKEIKGLEFIDKAIVVDQSPIGKTPRSNPATYTGVFTSIRELFSSTNDAMVRGYGPGRFSFNTKEGRCPYCEGDGVKKIEMYFLPPVYVKCEYCDGKRFNKETLDVTFKGKNIADVLNMTINESLDFFKNQPKIIKILHVLDDVGLGYLKLGQSSTTLSGGESQRIKLATELSKKSTTKTFYILDEPTTGLHFSDIEKLLKILHNLVDKGNTVLVIEHNMDVILNSDYIIDIGLSGGDEGGEIIVCGDIEDVKNCKKSFTGYSINKYLNNR